MVSLSRGRGGREKLISEMTQRAEAMRAKWGYRFEPVRFTPALRTQVIAKFFQRFNAGEFATRRDDAAAGVLSWLGVYAATNSLMKGFPYDKVAGELKNVYIAGNASKLTINSGDVTVNAFSSEGTFTTAGNLAIKSAVANGGSVVAGGNVTLASGTENVFGSLNATGKVTGEGLLFILLVNSNRYINLRHSTYS